MLKKAMILGIFCAVTAMPGWADGLYAGFGVGRDTADFGVKHTITKTDTFFDTSISKTDTENAAGNGYLGSIFAGYGVSFNKFYLAGELGVQTSSLEYNNSLTNSYGNTQKTTISIDYNLSASILPGYKVSDNTLIYGRVGYVYGDFDINNKFIDTNGNSFTTWDKGRGLNGIRYGVGIQTKTYKKLDLRLEYNHIVYQDFNTSSSYRSGWFETTTNTLRISPSTDQVELAAVYNFG